MIMVTALEAVADGSCLAMVGPDRRYNNKRTVYLLHPRRERDQCIVGKPAMLIEGKYQIVQGPNVFLGFDEQVTLV